MCMYVLQFKSRLVRLALAARVPRRHVGELAGRRHVGAVVARAVPAASVVKYVGPARQAHAVARLLLADPVGRRRARRQVPHTYSKSRHSWSASNRAKKNQLFMSFMREKMNGAKIRVPLCMQAFVQMSQDEYS